MVRQGEARCGKEGRMRLGMASGAKVRLGKVNLGKVRLCKGGWAW